MSHLKKQTKKGVIYFAAFNPLTGDISIGEIQKGLQVETGHPCLFTSTNKKKAYDMAYSEWSEDEDGNITGTPREYDFSIYDGETDSELNEILTDINLEDGVGLSEIKRPKSKDKLLMFSEYSFSQLSLSTQEKLMSKKTLRDGKRLKAADIIGEKS